MKRRLLILLLSFVIVFGFVSDGTYAAAKIKTVKTSVTDKMSEKKIIKKSPAVKKGTTYVKSSKSATTFVKFTAPKTKTYTFTFTPVFTEEQEENWVLGYFQICSVSYDALHTLSLKTEGGKYIALNVSNELYANETKDSKPKSKRYLTSRSTKVKIKKGNTVYISRYFEKNAEPDKVNYNLTIK